VSFHLRNEGRGYLVAQVETDAYWLIPEQTWVSGNDLQVNAYVDTRRLRPGEISEGRLTIRSNGGEAQTTVRVRATEKGRPATVIKPPPWTASALLVLAILGGVWGTQQLLERWHLAFVLDDWTGWAAMPLAAIILTLTAMLGSMFQWERIARDAPLKLWGKDALWTLGSSLAGIFAGVVLTQILLPKLPGIPELFALDAIQQVLPLVMGGWAALAAASGWGAVKRQNTKGVIGFIAMTLVWLLTPAAGAYIGLILVAVLSGHFSAFLQEDKGMGVVWGAVALLSLLVWQIAKLSGLMVTHDEQVWTPVTAAQHVSPQRKPKVRRTREPLVRGYWLAGLGALGTLAGSFLPWITITSDNLILHRWNALAMAGRTLGASTNAQLPPETTPLWILPAIIASLLLVQLFITLILGRRSWLDAAGPLFLGSLALATLLFLYLNDQFTASLAIEAQTLHFELGFWITIIGTGLIILGGMINVVLLFLYRRK
jgi:hypothetical protein